MLLVSHGLLYIKSYEDRGKLIIMFICWWSDDYHYPR